MERSFSFYLVAGVYSKLQSTVNNEVSLFFDGCLVAGGAIGINHRRKFEFSEKDRPCRKANEWDAGEDEGGGGEGGLPRGIRKTYIEPASSTRAGRQAGDRDSLLRKIIRGIRGRRYWLLDVTIIEQFECARQKILSGREY